MPRNQLWVALALFVAVGLCDLTTHTYTNGEEVILFANTVGPFQNPQETYNYFSLPYCGPLNKAEAKSEGLGEALLGYELVKSEVPIKFKVDVQQGSLCQKKLTTDDADKFQDAILKQYWYQLFLDDLPIWGMVGEKLEDASGTHRYFLYTHKKFAISYNGDRVIEVNLTSENPVPVAKDTELEFTYSVIWSPSEVPFEHRFEKYLDFNFFEHQIHWFSILNSSMMVIFLVGLVSIILMRTLRRDFAKYSKGDEDPDDGGDVGDESGWKQVHGDVFRAPAQLMLFSALVGTGIQLVATLFFVLFFAIIGAYYETRGSMVSALVVAYSLTSFFGGYSSGGFYARNGGKNWTRAMLMQSFLFPGFSFGLLVVFDFIAVLYGSVSAIAIGAITSLVLIYFFVSVPLCLAGTILGRNWSGVADNPCRINPVPHQIPEKKWYLHPLVHIVLGGILPFGSIFIEMYFIFTSLWHYKYYYVYGFMLLVYIILIIVSVCVTIVSTYFLLNSEDYRWHWVSYLSSASTAGYVFLYSVYYFFVNTKMSGFFQTVYYFGYMTMFCFSMALLCGAIGFVGTSIFVRKIYQNVKID